MVIGGPFKQNKVAKKVQVLDAVLLHRPSACFLHRPIDIT